MAGTANLGPHGSGKKVMKSKTLMIGEGYMVRCPVSTWLDDCFGRLLTNNFPRIVTSAKRHVKVNIHLYIDHNASCLLPTILHNHRLGFLLGRLYYPGEIENNGYAKFWGVNKVHYGLCESGEFAVFQTSSRLFQLTYFVKYRRILLELNS